MTRPKSIRFFVSLAAATVVVVAMLAIGLHFFYREPAVASGPQAFQIEYLTPEEAAELLGEEPSRFRRPESLTLPPPPIDSGQDREPD
ncbi:MAG: hypothetical protein KJO55_06910 [Gammaproteobacteria bacterium]|nr:hypothetical protein [Gammaproteobacteria bacterium]